MVGVAGQDLRKVGRRGTILYPAYDDFEEKLRNRFWKDADEQIKRAQWEKLRQVNYKDGDKFFQEFEELAHYAGVRGNEQVMVAQIKRAARETSKNTIYAGDGDLPALYDDWKSRLLRIDSNWRLKQAEGMGRPSTNRKGASIQGSIDGVYRHKGQRQELLMEDEVSPWISARQPQQRSATRCGKLGHFKFDCPTAPKSREEHLRRVKRPLGQGNIDDNQGGKRGRREVIDSTYSAKDLVPTGTQIALDKCTYISVVSTAHSNIPAISPKDQELIENHTETQEPAVVSYRLDLRRVAYDLHRSHRRKRMASHLP